MILDARIADRIPGAEIDGELRLTRGYSGSSVRISPEKTADCLTAASFAMPSRLREISTGARGTNVVDRMPRAQGLPLR